MPMRLLAALAAIAVLFLAGCQDQPVSVTPELDPSFSRGGPADEAAVHAQIESLINQLFSQPERAEALALFAQVERHMSSGEVSEAQIEAFAIIDLLASSELNDLGDGTSAEDGAETLVSLLLDFVESEDLVIATVDEDGETVVTESGEAGVEVPPGAVDEETLFVISRVTLEPGEECLPTLRPQREGCYQYEAIPDQEFNTDLIVGICVDTSGLTAEQIEQLHLYKHDEGDPNVTELPNAAAPFLDCNGPVAWDGPSNPALRLAWHGVRTVARGIASAVGPEPLRATDTGLGGSVGSFSRIGWARSTLLIYGPSLTPLAADFRTDNEQTLAEDEGHHTVVVDGPTWTSMGVAGPGGFGDYDGFVIGDVGSAAALSDVASNSGTWSPVVTGPTVLSALHAGVHQCDLSFPDCANANAEQWHNPEARTLLRQTFDWITSDTGTGLYAAMGGRYQNTAGGPPGSPVDFLAGIVDVEVVSPAFPVRFLSKEDSVEVLDSTHPVLDGLTGAGFSGWFLSYHVSFGDVPSGFTNLADGFRDPDNFFDSQNEEWVDGPIAPAPFPVLLVRP